MGSISVCDLGEMIQPVAGHGRSEGIEEALVGFCTGFRIVALHMQPCFDKRRRKERPRGALMVGAITLSDSAFITGI